MVKHTDFRKQRNAIHFIFPSNGLIPCHSSQQVKNLIHMTEKVKEEGKTYSTSLSANCLSRIINITKKENMRLRDNN